MAGSASGTQSAAGSYFAVILLPTKAWCLAVPPGFPPARGGSRVLTEPLRPLVKQKQCHRICYLTLSPGEM